MLDLSAISTLGFFGNLGAPELIVLALIGLLIFGKRLPEVGKSIGRGIVEFKKGLAGIDEEIEQASRRPPQIEKHEPGHTMETGSEKQQAPASPKETHPSA